MMWKNLAIYWMKNIVSIGDTGAIISLATVNQLHLLDYFFDEIYIPVAVWKELNNYKNFDELHNVTDFFKDKVKEIHSFNDLKLLMDLGESEAVLLYNEMNADVLIIDDQKARKIAESININCIGSLALFIKAKEERKIENLREIFIKLIENKRFFSKNLLNSILKEYNEKKI